MSASPWAARATGSSFGMISDADEVRRSLVLFADPNAGCELFHIKSFRSVTLVGSDIDGLCKAAAEFPDGQGIYFRVNPVPATLTHAARKDDILRRRWIYIDIDPEKDDEHKDDSATDVEKEATAGVCGQVNDYLAGKGWPSPIVVDSGNGFGVFYSCDLPNDKTSQALLQRILADLSEMFSGPNGTIDKSVHNATRLAKLPGTWARKGVQSDDRPHRPCRLLVVPSKIEPVTVELLHAAIVETPRPEPRPSPPPPTQPPFSSNGSTASYARKALDEECTRVILSKPGERNNNLNRAAFSLGQLVAGGSLLREVVETRLYDAACRCGLDKDPGCGERGIRSTIASGINSGDKEPRTVPVKNEPKAKFERSAANGQPQAKPDENEPLTVNLRNVKPLKVDWLIKNRIPKRFITVFAGRTGVGKSFVACDLIAKLSMGQEIPFQGGECFPAGGTLIVSEDSHEYVLAPRLIDAGADMGRINAMTWAAMAKYHLGDTDMLGRAVGEVPGGVSLVLIDPPTNFLEGTDEHKNSEVRQLVMRVVEWALGRDLAVLFILHVNKQSGKGVEALNRVMGSVAWVTTARIAHTFCNDPETKGQHLWVPLKNNLGPLGTAIAYRISEESPARVEWVGEVDTTADEALGHAEPRVRRDIAAADWLVDRFKEELEWGSEKLFERAKQDGISRNAMFEAKKSLDLPRARRTVQENGDEVYTWWVSKEWLDCQLAKRQPTADRPKPSKS